jgi:calcium-dependent protein kinase
VKIIKKD